MPRKIIKKVIDDVRISDSISATVIRGVIIPVNFADPKLKVNYFVPRFKKVVKGEEVEWQNEDVESHHLKFYEVSNDEIKFLFDLGRLEPSQKVKKKFDFDLFRIDYLCTLHNNEVGTIIIYPRPEHEMTNTQQLRFLSKIFDIKPPTTLSHLRSR